MHEHQVSASASALAVAHRGEISLSSPSPNAVAQSNFQRPEQNPSVSNGFKHVVAITDDQQAQQSMSGIFANPQNVLINGGTFIVSLCYSCVSDFGIYSINRMFSPLILVERI